ncbi:DNA packaging protein [Candidatus Woesearchaeota archaeon]|nr:DNA packaging protein [Candidatus Woesearchaeota archaeon]
MRVPRFGVMMPAVSEASYSDADVRRTLARYARAVSEDRLHARYWRTYGEGNCSGGPYDWAVRFHAAGKRILERALMAANKVGKSETASAEVAIHLVGDYPPWWGGRVWTRPVDAWVGTCTNGDQKDGMQEKLLGRPGQWGTGWIPKSAIDFDSLKLRQCGVSDVVDTVRVRHKSGGWSRLGFRTYEMGRTKWQSTDRDIVVFDEEPPEDIYYEGLTRVGVLRGMVLCSFTPLKGATKVVRKYQKGGEDVFTLIVGWNDAPHLSEEYKAKLRASFPEYMLKARTEGVPMLGEGAVFAVDEAAISVDPFEVPGHFRRIVGLDFGYNDPTAAAWLAQDADADVWYVTNAHRKEGESPVYHAETIKRGGDWIPVAWPHDGLNKERSGGACLKDRYLGHGLNMLGMSARYKSDVGGRQPVEPALDEILEYMRTGRFKVVRTLREWFEEFRGYHRKDGKVVGSNDHLMDATRYAWMMRRFALTQTSATMARPSHVRAYDPHRAYKRAS